MRRSKTAERGAREKQLLERKLSKRSIDPAAGSNVKGQMTWSIRSDGVLCRAGRRGGGAGVAVVRFSRLPGVWLRGGRPRTGAGG